MCHFQAHSLGLKSDWYLNNCICGEKGKLVAGFAPAGNAKALVALGFDGTKIDGCGPDRNVTEFAALVDAAAAAAATAGAAAKPITIEDCNGTVHYSSPHTHFQLSYSLSIFIPKSQTLQHPLAQPC